MIFKNTYEETVFLKRFRTLRSYRVFLRPNFRDNFLLFRINFTGIYSIKLLAISFFWRVLFLADSFLKGSVSYNWRQSPNIWSFVIICKWISFIEILWHQPQPPKKSSMPSQPPTPPIPKPLHCHLIFIVYQYFKSFETYQLNYGNVY